MVCAHIISLFFEVCTSKKIFQYVICETLSWSLCYWRCACFLHYYYLLHTFSFSSTCYAQWPFCTFINYTFLFFLSSLFEIYSFVLIVSAAWKLMINFSVEFLEYHFKLFTSLLRNSQCWLSSQPSSSLIKYIRSKSPLVLYHVLSLIFQFAMIHKFMIPVPSHAAVTALAAFNFVLSIQLEFMNQSRSLAVFLKNFMFHLLFDLIKLSVDVSCLVGTHFLPPKILPTGC